MDGAGTLKISVRDEDQTFLVIDVPGVEGRILGRSSAQSGYIPDIDLAAYGAREGGVSRRHAVFVRYQERVHVVDLGSVNGTKLNGEPLQPQVPYPVRSGDQLSVGNLQLSIVHVDAERA